MPNNNSNKHWITSNPCSEIAIHDHGLNTSQMPSHSHGGVYHVEHPESRKRPSETLKKDFSYLLGRKEDQIKSKFLQTLEDWSNGHNPVPTWDITDEIFVVFGGIIKIPDDNIDAEKSFLYQIVKNSSVEEEAPMNSTITSFNGGAAWLFCNLGWTDTELFEFVETLSLNVAHPEIYEELKGLSGAYNYPVLDDTAKESVPTEGVIKMLFQRIIHFGMEDSVANQLLKLKTDIFHQNPQMLDLLDERVSFTVDL